MRRGPRVCRPPRLGRPTPSAARSARRSAHGRNRFARATRRIANRQDDLPSADREDAWVLLSMDHNRRQFQFLLVTTGVPREIVRNDPIRRDRLKFELGPSTNRTAPSRNLCPNPYANSWRYSLTSTRTVIRHTAVPEGRSGRSGDEVSSHLAPGAFGLKSRQLTRPARSTMLERHVCAIRSTVIRSGYARIV